MITPQRPLALTFLATVPLVLSTACSRSSDGYEYVADSGPSTVAVTPSGPSVTPNELVGHWSSPDYGDTYIQRKGASWMMVYPKNDGRIVGTLTGATFVGWWTETPTRRSPDDAGEIQFTVMHADNQLIAQGKWRNGTTGDFETDWKMVKVDNAVPPTVQVVFMGQAGFLPHP